MSFVGAPKEGTSGGFWCDLILCTKHARKDDELVKDGDRDTRRRKLKSSSR